MVEASPAQLTEAEAEVYDRQIRLWGIEAQAKLRNAKVLVIGMDGLGAEIVKNIVLSGVKSVKMLDDKVATEKDLRNQFFIPPTSIGENRAEISQPRAQALNPLVTVTFDKKSISEKPSEYITNFDVIISCNQQLSINLRLSTECHKHKKSFYACSVFGTYGVAFSDLNAHKFTAEKMFVKKTGDIRKPQVNEIYFPELKKALEINTGSPEFIKSMRKIPPSFFILKVLLKFQEDHGRDPTPSEEDFLNLLKIRDSIFQNEPRTKEKLPDILFRCVTSGMPNPCCAITGAVVAQDVVKAVSGKGQPLRNFFFFDPITLTGHIQYIGPTNYNQTS